MCPSVGILTPEPSWNSVVVMSLPFVSYPWAVVTNDFLTATDHWDGTILHSPIVAPAQYGSYNLQSINSVYELRQAASGFERLTPKECIDAYSDPLKATSAVIIVGSNITAYQNYNRSLIAGWVSGWDDWPTSNKWICASHYVYQDPSYFTKWCTRELMEGLSDPWVWADWGKNTTIEVDHCLLGPSGDNNQSCGLHYNFDISAAVCACTLMSAILIIYTWHQHVHGKKNTLVTMGDAVAEFLETRHYKFPDADSQISRGLDSKRRKDPVRMSLAEWSVGRPVPWTKAVSGPVWLASLIV